MAGESPFTPHNQYTSDKPQRHQSYRGRLHRGIILLLLITAGFCLYTVQLANLQLIQGAINWDRAENNRLRLVPIPAKRGEIFDRHNQRLTRSRLARSVYIWPREQSPQQWQEIATQLGPILDITPQEIINLIENKGYNSHLFVLIKQDITPGMFIALAERSEYFKGVEVRGESQRYYPHNHLASHILGYIGAASLQELKANPQYPMGMLTGKMGIERIANSSLEGVWGNRLIEVNSRGEEIQELGIQQPQPGQPLQLTLDLELQKTAETALGDRSGAVVVLDVKTGAILAMVSHPSFNPNIFSGPMTAQQWQQLQSGENPMLNRAVQGYPSGSTFKIVTAIAGIESGKFSPNSTVPTAGAITIGGVSFHEHSNSGYGTIGFRKALAVSSNTFFYQVGMAAGPHQISKWGKELGIGGSINLDLLGLDGANHGQIPTPEQKQAWYGEPWYVGDTVTMAIGQGLVLATPLELAVMTSTVANGGYRVQPHLLASQTNTDETKPIKTSISAGSLNVVRQGLIDTVKEGTARILNDGSIPLTGGKTGTVEIPGHPNNSMYVAFGPADQPEIAIAVLVERGGYGSVSAAPIAKAVFQTYFNGRK
ncbi:penicillin-binding protein 2 [Limnospira fusiformis KN01]|uniref:penicillin-binding protein 2 n=1 Tax=Limnospira TaxID=2596745 RepID=UPI00165889A7|nr:MULTISPECIES: penicillin-binding protein 2 [Limnospira]MDT9198116.1 penicillin-binding protein 2 [Limnospira sp. PMC 1042.18]ULB47728.1 penicillin-binding protein 2 [Limnospira fusiformis KN01]